MLNPKTWFEKSGWQRGGHYKVAELVELIRQFASACLEDQDEKLKRLREQVFTLRSAKGFCEDSVDGNAAYWNYLYNHQVRICNDIIKSRTECTNKLRASEKRVAEFEKRLATDTDTRGHGEISR